LSGAGEVETSRKPDCGLALVFGTICADGKVREEDALNPSTMLLLCV